MSKKKTQEEFEKELYKINPNIEVIGKYINSNSKIHCKCKIDGYEWNPKATNLLQGRSCPVCSHKIVTKGVNDMWTTNPKLARLLANPDDGYKYSNNSGKRLNWKCPLCGNIIKNRVVYSIHKYGLSCPACSDGISYPEKFMFNVLQQLNINFEYQKKFDWCKYELKNKTHYGIYDFYIPSKQIIIEMDGGLGHGNCDTKILTKEESLKIDDIKDKLAQEHNIEIIRIDCNYGLQNRFVYIKNSIVNELSKLLDLSMINWVMVNRESQKSLVKQVCDLWNQNKKSTSDIKTKLALCKGTIIHYLKIGKQIGYCDYDSNSMEKVMVYCIELNKVFNSISNASKETNTPTTNISSCCKHKRNYAGKLLDGTPLHWIYYENYLNI